MSGLPDGWVETTLGDVSIKKQYGYTESASLEKVGPKFLRITDIQYDFINWTAVPYCPITDSNYLKYKLEVGDVVIARTGNSTGATATIKDNVDAVFASYLIRFKINPIKVHYNYIDFLLRSFYWRSFVKSIKSGSAQGGANANDFAEFPINLPSLNEQKTIANILSSFDEKIELLREQNETLETLAQTIFKEWFVNFNYPDATGEMEGSELGDIPKGWRVGKLNEQVNITMGQSPKGDSYNELSDGMVFYQGRAEFQSRFPQRRLHTTEPKRIAEKFDVLMSVRAPVGDINVATEQCCIGRGLAAINSEYKSYALYRMKSLKKEFDKFESEGTVFGSINKNSLEGIKVVIPLQNIIESYDLIAHPLDEKIYQNFSQIQTLTKTRDTLLPKLMSGQVRVN